ncbi:MAG: transposase [Dehalococcoidia bacterium]
MTWPNRRSIRLRGYDYSQPGAYYVTVCSAGRECLFSEVVEGAMRLSHLGSEVEAAWSELPSHYPMVDLDAFVVMPNHVHGVIVLLDGAAPEEDLVGAGLRPSRQAAPTCPHTLPEVIRAFKSFSARRTNALRGTTGAHVWQRNYYERVVRSERELERIREYIENNPAQWENDREHPSGPSARGETTERRDSADDIERVLRQPRGRV